MVATEARALRGPRWEGFPRTVGSDALGQVEKRRFLWENHRKTMGTSLLNIAVNGNISYNMEDFPAKHVEFGSQRDRGKTKRFLCAYTKKNEKNKLN